MGAAQKPVTLKDFLEVDEPEAEQPSARQFLSCDNVKDFCRGVLTSREYRQSIVDRVSLGSLAPAVECRLFDYAYGKPVERFEVKDTTDPLEELTIEQLEERAMKLLQVARKLKAQGERTTSVH